MKPSWATSGRCNRPLRGNPSSPQLDGRWRTNNVWPLWGRPIRWDQAKQEFPGDEEANRLTWRPMREPWRL